MGKLENNKQLLPSAWAELRQQALKLQYVISAWLNWRCRKLSAKALLVMLVAFCAICGAYLIWLITGNII